MLCISLQYAEVGQGRHCNLSVIPFSIGKREFLFVCSQDKRVTLIVIKYKTFSFLFSLSQFIIYFSMTILNTNLI